MRSKLCALAVAATLTVGSLAAAEPNAASRATARALLDDGYALIAKHDPQGALAKFTAADAIMNVPSTKLAMAQSHVALGQLVEAQDDLTAALGLPEPTRETPGLKKAREDCAKLLAETAPRVAELTLTLEEGGANAEVRVDGAVVPAAALTAPRRLNPGPHEVDVAGMPPQHVTLAEGERKSLRLGMPAPKKQVLAPPPPPVPAADRGSRAPWEIAGLAVGGTGIALGSVTGLLALGAKQSAETAGCVSDRCPPPAHGDVDAAKRWATISTIGFAVGLVGIAVAVVAFAWPTSPADQKP